MIHKLGRPSQRRAQAVLVVHKGHAVLGSQHVLPSLSQLLGFTALTRRAERVSRLVVSLFSFRYLFIWHVRLSLNVKKERIYEAN
jgi:hypothetical protein